MDASSFTLPRLYAILDREVLGRAGIDLVEAAGQLEAAGCTLMQYRDKRGDAAELLSEAKRLRARLAGGPCRVIVNDRVDVAVLSGCDGAHVGQTDLSPDDARHVLGPARILGVSTHTLEQLRLATEAPVDYVAIGARFCHEHEGRCGAGRGPGDGSPGKGDHTQAAGGHRWHHARISSTGSSRPVRTVSRS